MNWLHINQNDIRRKLQKLLENEYGIQIKNIAKFSNGYSNLNFHVQAKHNEYVVRVSNNSKHTKDSEREEHVLNLLGKSKTIFQTPSLVPTQTKSNGIYLDNNELNKIHVFEYISGTIAYKWHDVPEQAMLLKIAEAYKSLNAALSKIPINAIYNPIKKYDDLVKKISDTSWIVNQPLNKFLQKNIDHFFKKATKILVHATSVTDNFNKQWVHGDIQNENILFRNGAISGILDFEETNIEYLETDIIFSAFRICKQNTNDSHLVVDKTAFQQFINAYFKNTNDSNLLTSINYPFWKAFFALQQSLLYMKHAYHKTWLLDYNIGFLPCFNTVTNYIH